MATEFKLPDLGENIETAEVITVLVAPGETVEVDQTVLEVETDKATLEIPSSVGGRVNEVLVKAGDTISIGEVIFTLDGEGAAAAEEAAGKPPAKRESKAATAQPEAPPPAPGAAAVELAKEKEVEAAASAGAPTAGPTREGQPVSASPSVRRFARELGIDIHEVSGSGPGGRISVEDVKRHARTKVGGTATVVTPAAAGAAAAPLPDFAKWGPVERQKMNNVRKKTVQHLSLSWNTVPHVTLHDTADISSIENLRQKYKKKAEAAGGKLTVTAILMKVVASALKVHPKLNASVDVANQEVVLKRYYHIGVAADTDRGLVVPVVRDVDKKNIIELAVELTQLAEKARAGKLGLDQMQGATFTITNLGGIGVKFFTPIVNYPEVAILGVGRAVSELRQVDGEFEPRLMLPLSLSFDHRLVDGADGARFLRWIIEAIEEPMLLAMEG